MRELTDAEWTGVRSAYCNGTSAVCPACARGGSAELKPKQRVMRFACGHELTIPEGATP